MRKNGFLCGLMSAAMVFSGLSLTTTVSAETYAVYDETQDVYYLEEDEMAQMQESAKSQVIPEEYDSSVVLFDANRLESSGGVSYYYMKPTDCEIPTTYLGSVTLTEDSKVYLVDEADNVVQQLATYVSYFSDGTGYTYIRNLLSQYLEEGTYYFSVDGKAHIEDRAIVVTSKPVLETISSYSGIFDTAPVSEKDLYLSVSGVNIDMEKIEPYVADEEGNVISEVVDYLQYRENGYFHLRNISETSWNYGTLRVKSLDGYEVLNLDEVSCGIYVSTSPELYYAEYLPVTNKTIVYFANVPDDTTVCLQLTDSYSSDQAVLETRDVVVNNGKAELEFAYDLSQVSFLYLKYMVDKTQGSYSFLPYGNSSNFELDALTSSGGNHFRMNNVTVTLFLYKIASMENNIRLVFYEAGNLEDGPVKTVDVTKSNAIVKSSGIEYNTVKVTSEITDLPAGRYKVFAEIDGVQYEDSSKEIYVYDNEYHLYSQHGYLVEKPYVYFYPILPEDADESKLKLVVTDILGNEIPDVGITMKSNSKLTHYYGSNDIRGSVGYDLTGLDAYCNVYCYLTYDGKMPYSFSDCGTPVESRAKYYYIDDYYSNCRISRSVQNTSTASFQSRNRMVYGIRTSYSESPVTVKIYRPYDTAPVKSFTVPAGEQLYYFTQEDLEGVDCQATARYHLFAYDANGKALDSEQDYLIKYYNPQAENLVSDFVSRLYSLVLERTADGNGLSSWKNALLNQTSSGVDAGYGFVFSPECEERNLSDEAFVEMLYNTFMNRPSDEDGRNAWVSQLQNGVGREKILEGFIMSPEFAEICKEYGITVGSVSRVAAFSEALQEYRNQNADITAFVARCYTKALGREFDSVGLNDWCKVIITKSDTPTAVAKSFIFSEEFLGKGLDDTEYLKVLYRTFMGREADEEGLADWLGVLQSGEEDREKVLDGFADSTEFKEILTSFGLNE